MIFINFFHDIAFFLLNDSKNCADFDFDYFYVFYLYNFEFSEKLEGKMEDDF